MIITIKWLEEQEACQEGIDVVREKVGKGIDRDELLNHLAEIGETDWWRWLYEYTKKKCPPSKDVAFPDGLRVLDLIGAKLSKETKLPESLYRLSFERCVLPKEVKLPENLRVLSVIGGTIPKEIKMPKNLKCLYIERGSLPTDIPEGTWVIK